MTRSRFGHIRRLGEGRYRVYWRKDGQAFDEVVRGTLDDAEVFLASKRVEDACTGATWGEFWKSKVLPQIRGLATKTQEEYARLWRVELEPRIGSEAVSGMDWVRANAVLTDIAAPSVQRHAGALLKKMCNMAMRTRPRLLDANPVDRAIEYAAHRKKPKRPVESFEVRRYLDAFMQTKYAPVLIAELGAGLRVEEACALTWEDVSALEFQGRTYAALDVSKALVTTSAGVELKDTKNDHSARIAVCGEPFASRLLLLGEGRTGPLVPSGRPWRASAPHSWYTAPTTITHNWRQWCGRHGVRYVPQKDMRSAYATMMGEAGAADSVVSGNMGHADGTTKGRNYQGITVAAKCNAAQRLADWLENVQ